MSTMNLQLKETREPTLADRDWLFEVLNGTNNGYLFAPTGWHCRIGRAFPGDFDVKPQNGPWPWRVERKAVPSVAPVLEMETREEAVVRLARKLAAHGWDLSSLSGAERAFLVEGGRA